MEASMEASICSEECDQVAGTRPKPRGYQCDYAPLEQGLAWWFYV